MSENRTAVLAGGGEVTLERANFAACPELAGKVMVYKDGSPWAVLDADEVERAVPQNDVLADVPKGEVPSGTGFEVVPMKSVFGGTFPVAAGTQFVNVEGSSGDHPTDVARRESWRRFWEIATGLAARACTAAGSANVNCNAPIYGGHVVAPGAPVQPQPGANHVVFIVPICNAHNNRTNTNVMTAAFATTGVWLDNYHR